MNVKILNNAVFTKSSSAKIATLSPFKIVKDTFRKVSETDSLSKGLPNIPEDKLPDFKIITKKGIVPTDKEEEENHRAHSARLRVIERIK